MKELHKKHQDLLQTYSKQADEVSRLRTRMLELFTELTAARGTQDSPFSDLMVSDKFDKLDVFSSIGIVYNYTDLYRNNGLGEVISTSARCPFGNSL